MATMSKKPCGCGKCPSCKTKPKQPQKARVQNLPERKRKGKLISKGKTRV